MKKRISFKMWIAVFFGGIWQFIRNIFSWKNKTPFWRVIWATITICVVIFTALLCCGFYYEYFGRYRNSNSYREAFDTELSDNFKFRDNGRDCGKSYIYDRSTRKRVIDKIDWVAVPMDGDSLIVVAKDGKRQYVNRFTGEVAIPQTFDAAWSFSDGVAAVCTGDSVHFIDHSGRPINDRKYLRKKGYRNYAYHNGLMALPDENGYGLVDKQGEWVVLPVYSEISYGAQGVWYADKDGKSGVLGPDGNVVLPVEYEQVWIHPVSGITVADATDHTQRRYDYDGTLLDNFIFDYTSDLYYGIDGFDEEGNQLMKLDEMVLYASNGYKGLMTREGVAVTPPLYFQIECLAPGAYRCRLSGDSSDYIMVNAKGEKVNG